MTIAYYFRECPTCRNHDLALVRDRDLRLRSKLGVSYRLIDERYIVALPDVWGEDAKILGEQGAKLPFLYDDVSCTFLNVSTKTSADADDDDKTKRRSEMAEEIDEFLDVCVNYVSESE